MDTYEKILGSDFAVAATFSKQLCDVLSKLLRKQPSKRLGSAKGGAAAVVRFGCLAPSDLSLSLSSPSVGLV